MMVFSCCGGRICSKPLSADWQEPVFTRCRTRQNPAPDAYKSTLGNRVNGFVSSWAHPDLERGPRTTPIALPNGGTFDRGFTLCNSRVPNRGILERIGVGICSCRIVITLQFWFTQSVVICSCRNVITLQLRFTHFRCKSTYIRYRSRMTFYIRNPAERRASPGRRLKGL